MNKFRLLSLDIDGTTLNGKGELRPRVAAAIARARHGGLLVTLATGRSLRAALPVAKALALDAPLILSNGALVLAPATGQTFLERPLDTTVAVQTARTLSDLGFAVYANRHALAGPDLFYDVMPPAPEQQLLLRREPEFLRQVDDMTELLADVQALKVLTVDRTASIQQAAERLRQSLTGDFAVLVTDEAPGYSLLEVAPAGVTKATGLAHLAAMYGIDPGEIIAFGDNYNDLEMLRFAGMGVAMGNAPVAVKQAARMVTATNDEDGVALFLEQHIAQVA